MDGVGWDSNWTCEVAIAAPLRDRFRLDAIPRCEMSVTRRDQAGFWSGHATLAIPAPSFPPRHEIYPTSAWLQARHPSPRFYLTYDVEHYASVTKLVSAGCALAVLVSYVVLIHGDT